MSYNCLKWYSLEEYTSVQTELEDAAYIPSLVHSLWALLDPPDFT